MISALTVIKMFLFIELSAVWLTFSTYRGLPLALSRLALFNILPIQFQWLYSIMKKSGLCCLAMQPTNFLYFPAYKTHIIVLYITQYSFNFLIVWCIYLLTVWSGLLTVVLWRYKGLYIYTSGGPCVSCRPIKPKMRAMPMLVVSAMLCSKSSSVFAVTCLLLLGLKSWQWFV